MHDERAIYISPEDSFSEICERLEHAGSRHVVLVIPLDNQLRAFGTWRMLHAYTRRHGITVRVSSTSAYIRSLAHSARFTVTKSPKSSAPEKQLHRRPSAHFARPPLLRKNREEGEAVNLFFPINDELRVQPAQKFSPAEPVDPFGFMFEEDDVLIPPHPAEPPVRISKPPQPLNMPPLRRVRPLSPPPRLPWDDVDDEMLPQPRSLRRPIRRRTDALARPTLRSRGAIRGMGSRGEPLRFVAMTPIVFVCIFVLVRSIVQYLRKR